LRSNSILPFSPLPRPHTPSFCLPSLPDCRLRLHFYINPLGLAPTRYAALHSHLASAYAFFSTRPVRAQTTRLRLKHLNKLTLRPSLRSEAQRKGVRSSERPMFRGLNGTEGVRAFGPTSRERGLTLLKSSLDTCSYSASPPTSLAPHYPPLPWRWALGPEEGSSYVCTPLEGLLFWGFKET
jgi:hypothetical protein